MSKENLMAIAGTILTQIKSCDSESFGRWNIANPFPIAPFEAKDQTMYYLGGISFSVHTVIVGRARVMVLLKALDTYDILITHQPDHLEIKQVRFDGVYCDQLGDILGSVLDAGERLGE